MPKTSNQKSESVPKLMTVVELSDYLRVSRASVYRLVKDKKVPVSRIGRHLRFRKLAIDAWLSKKESDSRRK